MQSQLAYVINSAVATKLPHAEHDDEYECLLSNDDVQSHDDDADAADDAQSAYDAPQSAVDVPDDASNNDASLNVSSYGAANSTFESQSRTVGSTPGSFW